jgi:endonuclease-8
MRALVGVDEWVAVCFSAPDVELTAEEAVGVAHLGPDLCGEDADLDEVLRRVAAEPAGRPVLDALLDQRIASGIGNVYKSEVLFACGVHPATPLGELSPDARRRLWATAAEQLRANLGGGGRDTTGGAGLAVYGRRSRPCLRCGTPIQWAALGEHHRGTSWCPTCQPADSPSGVEG